MHGESSTKRQVKKRSLAELVDSLRDYLGQDFSVFDVRDGAMQHAGEILGKDAWGALRLHEEPASREFRVVACCEPIVCLVVPLGVAGHRDTAAVGVFRTRELRPADDLAPMVSGLAADLNQFESWAGRQPAYPIDVLTCLGRLVQDKLTADHRILQLDFQVEQLGTKIGESYEEISLVYQVVENLRDVAGPEELARYVLDWAVNLLPAEQAIVQMFEPGKGEATENAKFLTMGQDHLDRDDLETLIELTTPDVSGLPFVLNAETMSYQQWPFPAVRELIVVPLRADRYNAGWLVVINHAEGSWLGTHHARLLSAAATMMGVRVMMNDFGELRKAAKAANLIKSRVLASISHELRTPLNGVLGFSRILLDVVPNGEAEIREGLETIEGCAEQLLQIVNDLFEIHDLDIGRIQVQRTACRLDEILLSVESKLQHRAAAKGLTLEAMGPTGTIGLIHSDPHRLTQLLTILVRNSIKFTERGGVRIETNIIRSDDKAGLQLMVIDTGVGIPAEKLDAIFDPFLQSEPSATRTRGGLGLGLVICRQVAESLGGTLTAANRPEGGSIFTVELGQETISLSMADCGGQQDSAAAALVATERN